MRRAALLLLLALPAPALAREIPAKLFTPASATYAATADVRTLSPERCPYIRYLSLYNATTAQELQQLFELVSFCTNSLSFKHRAISLPVKVDVEGRLLRIDLQSLGVDPAAWDSLARDGSGSAPLGDPFFHELLEVEKVEQVYYPAGTYDGKFYPAGNYPVKKKQRVHAQASWLPKAEALELVGLLQSEYGILRGDWFCVYALQPPAYYKFAGNPKDLSDFLKLAGVDAKVFDRESTTLRGIALFSEVASRNRALERVPSETNYGRGYFLQSFDYFKSIREDDLLKDLLRRKRDAGELIWSLPNGLQGYGLINGQEKTIEFADPRIATDNRYAGHDKVVWAGWKCVGCHAAGTIPVADEVRLSAKDSIGLLVSDPKQARAVQDRYFGESLNGLLQADAQNYAAAVKQCTGKDASAVSLDFMHLQRWYTDRPLTIEDVSVECGYPVVSVKEVVGNVGRTGGLSHVFVTMLRGRKARRDHFEEAFPELMRLLPAVVKGEPKP